MVWCLAYANSCNGGGQVADRDLPGVIASTPCRYALRPAETRAAHRNRVSVAGSPCRPPDSSDPSGSHDTERDGYART